MRFISVCSQKTTERLREAFATWQLESVKVRRTGKGRCLLHSEGAIYVVKREARKSPWSRWPSVLEVLLAVIWQSWTRLFTGGGYFNRTMGAITGAKRVLAWALFAFEPGFKGDASLGAYGRGFVNKRKLT